MRNALQPVDTDGWSLQLVNSYAHIAFLLNSSTTAIDCSAYGAHRIVRISPQRSNFFRTLGPKPLCYHRREVTLEASYPKLQLSSKTKVSDRILVIAADDLGPHVCHSINNNKAQLSLTNPRNDSG